MEKEKDPRINKNKSFREFWVLFFVLAAFNGFHMWIYQIFVNNGMIESLLRFVITMMVLYVIVTALMVTFSIAFARRYLYKALEQLSEAARKVANGDFSIRVVSISKGGKKDFIDVLYDDFNTMTENLFSANEKLKALATTDELTKLDNRRSFLEHIDLIWKQNHRLNLPVTILMIDVDFFKKYNDSLGHLEGDKALIAIAQCLKNNVKRETDFVARFGGEEFVCLLPFLEKDEALEFAKAMVQSVEEMKIPHPMSVHSKYVTISVGMAIAVPNDNNSYSQLLDEADKALYSAKETGRNRVVMN